MKKFIFSICIIIMCLIPIQIIAEEQTVKDVFIDAYITEAYNYRDLCYALNNASENEIFIFHLNTDGGDLFTALQLYNVIKNSKATTIANIYKAYSGGSIIAMACDKVIINDFATMMVHSINLGKIEGSSAMLNSYIDFFLLLNNDILDRIFKNFLSVNEINNIKNDVTLWLSEKELKKRFKKINKVSK